MDLSTLLFLLSSPGEELLREVESRYDGDNALTVSAHLQPRYPHEHIAAALTQVRLRRRAVTKFGADAHRLYFTSDSLQQATHHRVAAHRATRAAKAAATIVDLGCGIGADLLAFGRVGLGVTGIELDPLTAALARANLAACGLPGDVLVADATAGPLPDADLRFCDPARRGPVGRIFDPASYSPPWSFVAKLLSQDAVVKLAPGLPHERVPDGVEAEWVSLDGKLREAVLWAGSTADARRRATVLSSQGAAVELTDADTCGEPEIRAVGRYVYEPDDAVTRAHLVGAFAQRCSGWLLEEHLAYVSSDELPQTPIGALGRVFEVLETLPFKEKALRAALQARGVGSLTIKKRGVAITPEELRKRLNLKGDEAATIILTRTPDSAVTLLVRPLPSPT